MSEAGAAPSAQGLEALYLRLSSGGLVEALGFQGQPAPELLRRRLDALKQAVEEQLSRAPDPSGIGPRVLARLAELERIVHDPLECFIVVRAGAMGLDPSRPDVRAPLEASFLEQHVPSAVWAAHTGFTDADARDSARVPVSSEVELRGPDGVSLRLRVESLSKAGVCAHGVPPAWQGGPLTVELPLQDRPAVRLEGEIAWRRDDRVGVRFREVPFAEGLAVEKVIDKHHREILALAERYLELAPTHPAAVASAFLARYFVAASDTERASLIDRLVAAADQSPRAVDLQLALARVCLAAGQQPRFERAIERARAIAPKDPRIAQLSRSVKGPEKKRRTEGGGLRQALQQTPAAGVAILVVGALFSAGYIALRSPSSVEQVEIDAAGLPCVSAQLAGPTLFCEVERAGWDALSEDARSSRAEITLGALKARGVTSLLVSERGGQRTLGSYGDLAPLPTK